MDTETVRGVLWDRRGGLLTQTWGQRDFGFCTKFPHIQYVRYIRPTGSSHTLSQRTPATPPGWPARDLGLSPLASPGLTCEDVSSCDLGPLEPLLSLPWWPHPILGRCMSCPGAFCRDPYSSCHCSHDSTAPSIGGHWAYRQKRILLSHRTWPLLTTEARGGLPCPATSPPFWGQRAACPWSFRISVVPTLWDDLWVSFYHLPHLQWTRDTAKSILSRNLFAQAEPFRYLLWHLRTV